MATLLPSIIDMQRHMASEVETLRQNMHKLEDFIGRIATEQPRSLGHAAPNDGDWAATTKATPTTASCPPPDASWPDALAQVAQDVRNFDLKLEQYIAHFQVENSQKTLLLHEMSSKLEDERRNEQLRSDLTHVRMEEISAQVDGIYATNHGDHIRIDVMNSNLQEIVATIATVNTSVESIGTSMGQLKSSVAAFQTTVNDRLDALEAAASSDRGRPT